MAARQNMGTSRIRVAPWFPSLQNEKGKQIMNQVLKLKTSIDQSLARLSASLDLYILPDNNT